MAILTFLFAFGSLLAGGAKGAMQGIPGPASLVVAAQDGLTPEITVSWNADGEAPATGATVGLLAEASLGSWKLESLGSCTASCRSIAFRYLQFGTTYEAIVWLTNGSGAGPSAASGPIVLRNRCPLRLCFAVDAQMPVEPAFGQASGLLNSMTGSPVLAARLSQLHAKMWRSANSDLQGGTGPWGMVQTQGIPTTFVLSDKWFADTARGQVTPWSDWTRYRDWVIASVRQLVNAGIHIDYWDVYNEPDGETSAYYPPAEAASVTPQNLLTQFLVAYQAIRSVVPDAQIIGPSSGSWVEDGNPHMYSMRDFLDFAASQHLSLAAVSWHYNARNPQRIVDEVAEARRLIAERPALGSPQVFLNEFGTPGTQRIPGWDVQYLAALTDSGVDSAGRSCWGSDCSLPVLDGLLSPGQLSTLPDFWLRTYYAQMSGNMVATSSNSDNAAVIASFDNTQSVVRILGGFGQGCLQDPRCTADRSPGLPQLPMASSVIVIVPWTSGHVIVTQSRIPGTSLLPISQPAARAIGTVPIQDQAGRPTVTIDLGLTADGDAWSLTLTHVG